MTDQVEEFRKTRKGLNSVLKKIEFNINALQFQQANERLQGANKLHEHLEILANSSSDVQQRSLQSLAVRIQALDTQMQDGLARQETGKRVAGLTSVPIFLKVHLGVNAI